MNPVSRPFPPYRILALDGGGTFCLIQAKALADLFPGLSGRAILGQFDLVAGCSGGAIVTAALLDDKTPDDILDLFLRRAHRQRLFSALRWYQRPIHLATRAMQRLGLLSSPFGPRFSTAHKLDFLHDVLPNAGRCPLGELGDLVPRAGGGQTDFLFVTYDFDHDRTRMLRSRLASPAANFPRGASRITLAEAVHASSTAPINWFQEPAQFDGRRYWDGAMTSYNNPVLAAVTEALANGVPAESIEVLSIGTSTVFPKAGAPDGFAGDLLKLANLVVTDPPDAHSFIAHVAMGGRLPDGPAACPAGATRLVRLNPVVQRVFDPATRTFRWPAAWRDGELQRLIAMDIAATEDADVALIVRLADEWLADGWNNQPIRSGGRLFDTQRGACDGIDAPQADALLCEIGHPRYSAARARWQHLSSGTGDAAA